MTDTPAQQPPGWYYAQGDPPGTQRYWDGTQWQGGPQAVPTAGGAAYGAGAGVGTLADGGTRILSRLIDFVIIIIISAIVAGIIGGGTAAAFSTDYDLRAVIAGFIGGLLVIAYEVGMTSSGGQTLGKKALGIKIVNEDGSDLDLNQAAKRFSPYIAGTFLNLIPVIGALFGLVLFVIGIASLVMIFTDAKNQAVWDKIANTLVIKP